MSAIQSLGKEERLKSRKEIESLFKEGKSIFSFPYKLVYIVKDSERKHGNTKLLVSIPKRKFKKAVDRNLIRRRIKDAFRKNKEILVQPFADKDLQLSVIYVHDEIRDFNELQKRLVLSLHKLNLQLESHK